MLATLAALQLALLAPEPPPPAVGAPPDAKEGAATEASGAPLPSKRAAPAPAGPPAPRQLSLLSGEPLGGGSVAAAWAGWSSLGLAYGQGVTELDDLAGVADLDWSTAELRLGGLYRRGLGRLGGWDLAGKLGVAWYRSFGATFIHGGNHSDRGLELAPGVAISSRTASGTFSLAADAPLTFTIDGGGGLLFSPRLWLAYEAPVYPDVTLGVRAGAGYRAGSGDAPLATGRAELAFLFVAGYRLF